MELEETQVLSPAHLVNEVAGMLGPQAGQKVGLYKFNAVALQLASAAWFQPLNLCVAYQVESWFQSVLSHSICTLRYKKGLQLIVDVQPSIPLLVRSDPMKLKQVIVNLLSNSIKFTQVGKVSITVSAASEVEASAVETNLRMVGGGGTTVAFRA